MKYVTMTLLLPESEEKQAEVFQQMRISSSPIEGTRVVAFAAGDSIGELMELQEKYNL